VYSAFTNDHAGLRDLDPSVYDECVRLGNGSQYIEHYRWCETLAGEEYARNQAWCLGDRKGEVEQLSACRYMGKQSIPHLGVLAANSDHT
jgi:hypothetical protein